MKTSSLLLVLTSTATATVYKRFNFPGLEHMVAGQRLFPANVIAGFNADYSEYNASSWAKYVLAQCQGQFNASCDSTISLSAINSGTPKTRDWFGYVFRGGVPSKSDYHKAEQVEDTVVYIAQNKTRAH
ncbi:hypothetical protein CDD80_5002 [Ophiocordyceps camponoti-rufipedis]|uniref:Ecp2 effector protein domain-containing protein n=1 Tax=Ophiocordyceps camponoti-rufipedis TaxID=2004952 RepID=A0A2C5YQH7_9HYPO|nr:hypothetical protein CDD80_5002 [Ophiocordyceps camponoti-rufipedis]